MTTPAIATKFFTGKLEAFTKSAADGTTEYRLRGIASSTVKDRQGDVITASAQLQMEQQVQGMTLFLNHDYEVPESVLGTASGSSVVRAQDATYGECFDLVIEILVNQFSDRAMKTWRVVNAGTKLGLSVGCEILDFHFEGDTLHIDGVNLLEVSCVGIPAQQRAMVDVLAKSLRKSLTSETASRIVLDETISEPVPALADVLGIPEATLAPDNAEKHVEDVPTMEIEKSGARHSAADIKCLNACLESMQKALDHGPCDDIRAHLEDATKSLKSLFDDGTEAEPDDANAPDENADDANKSIEPDAISAQEIAPEPAVVVEAAPADDANKSADLELLRAQIETLTKENDALKAIPVGRVTAPAGSTVSSTADPDARAKMTEATYTAELSQLLRKR